MLALAALATGCAAPDSRPRATALDPATLGLSSAPGPAISDRWWTAFGDPGLDRVVADALAGNPSLDTAAARVREASALLDQQQGTLRPQLTLNAQEQAVRLSGRYTIPPPYAGTERIVGQALGNFQYNLDLFGRQRRVIAAAVAETRAARLDVVAARLQVTGAVVEAWLALARAERLAAIARDFLAAREGALRLVRIRIRNQLSSDLDARAEETLIAQARQSLVRAEAGRALAAHALAALAGRGADYYPTIPATALRLDAALPVPATLPADLVARRPDIVASLARIEAAGLSREGARRAFYPNVNLVALAGFQAIGFGSIFSTDAATYGGGAALDLPIFDGGRRRADLERSTARLDLAVADYNERVVAAVRDAADALARIATLERDRARQREIAAGLAETARLNAVRVASGLESRLGLVDTDLRLIEARQAQSDLDVEAALRRVELVLALGGGFPATAPDPEAAR